MHTSGVVEAIFVAPDGAAPMQRTTSVLAIEDRGLEGDRYAKQCGTFSRDNAPEQQVSLIEAEALEGARTQHGIEIDPSRTRRNILTRGTSLNHMVGRTFRIGEATLHGEDYCEPCGHMENLSEVEGSKKALVHRGGLRCRVVAGGTIQVGDSIIVMEDD